MMKSGNTMRHTLPCLMLLPLLFPACVSGDVFTETEGSVKVFYAETESSLDSRTSLDGFRRVLWSSGDRIAIFEKKSSASCYEATTASDGKTYAEFTPVSTGASQTALDHNVACYPYVDAECISVGNNAYMVLGMELPACQTWCSAGFDEGSFPMAAVSADNRFSFRNLCGGIRLQIKGTASVKSVELRGNANEYVAGPADVKVYTDGSVPEVKMHDTASKTVVLDCGEGVQLKEDEATDFIVVLPPTAFRDGFTVTVTDVEGGVMTVCASVANTVSRSDLLKMPEFVFTPSQPQETVLTECPFRRGINISDWLMHQTEEAIRPNLYTEQDFINLKSLGFDAVRLPVNFGYHVDENNLIEDYMFECLDRAVNWAENSGLYIIVDNHGYMGDQYFNDANMNTIRSVFSQLAQRYSTRSEKFIYELINEPYVGGFVDTPASKGLIELEKEWIAEIRKHDRKHAIIVTGDGCSRNNLKDCVFDDRNLIYTFHYYGPHLFTHQGSDWDSSPMQYLAAPVPFPYDADRMPAKPEQFVGNEFFESYYDDYPTDGNIEKIKEHLKTAADFAAEKNVPVFCGEWGVLNRMAEQEDYCFYHQEVRKILEEYGISWTLWAYRDDFSIFNRTGGTMFENNLNTELLTALGLVVPPSYGTSAMPSDVVFYDDIPASFTKPDSYNYDSEMTFESRYSPYSGERCIDWTIGNGNYGSFTFEIWPVADLTPQAAKDYDLRFMVRSSEALPAPLTVRFIEYNKETNKAWRYVCMLHNTDFAADGQWHEVRMPMSSFVNQGGYWGGEWMNAETSRPCDWTKINKLEFAVEGQSALIGHEISFDDISIVVFDDKWHINGFVMNPSALEW